MQTRLALLCMTALLPSCTMIPDFALPHYSSSPVWTKIDGYDEKTGEKTADQLDWKEFFAGEAFHQVIQIALDNNKDLKTAALNIDEARLLYRVDRADLLPNVNGDGSLTRAMTSDDSNTSRGRATKSDLYEANIGVAAYEFDLFGKIRSNNQSALNEYFATEQAAGVVRSALIAETANAYLQLLADEKLLSLTEKTLKAQQRTYDILSESLNKGVSTDQDVARALTAVESAKVNLHQYRRYVAQDKNALFLLLGTAHDDALLPQTTLDKITIKEDWDSSIPSEVLLKRPDIRQAEFTLKARNADIGAARAAFFPSISLTGAYGFASPSLSNLFTSGAAGAWSFIPDVTLPIFAGGRNKANLDLAYLRTEQAIVAYEKAVQIAFSEVADELASRATLDQQLKSQRRLVAAAQKVYDISYARYKSGIDSFLSVLDAQSELYDYQQSEINTQRQYWENLASLYKVLGGGAE